MARVIGFEGVKQIDAKRWITLEPLEYHVRDENSTEIIVVPKGTKTDFASMPKWLWGIFPPYGKHSSAALVHDHLYQNRGAVPQRTYTRKRCDEIFLEVMEVASVSWWRRQTMFRMVRLFGGPSWKKH